MFSYSRRSFLKSTAASAITLGFSGAAPRLAFAAPDLARLDGLAQANSSASARSPRSNSSTRPSSASTP